VTAGVEQDQARGVRQAPMPIATGETRRSHPHFVRAIDFECARAFGGGRVWRGIVLPNLRKWASAGSLRPSEVRRPRPICLISIFSPT
jgi:hypothetical protein